MNKFLTYAVMLDSLIVAYIQFIIMLTDLKEVLSQELSVFACVARLPLSYQNEQF